nr:MAG TPA: hypothetical protein [Caudoviricetes sp.]
MVDTESLATASVKDNKSCVGTPSCPPSSAIPQSSFTVIGIFLLIPINPFSIFCRFSSESSTVFLTPAKASSNSCAFLPA